MSKFRINKIESLLRTEVSALILSQKIKDPRVTPFLTVNRVTLSRDMVYAKLFVSSFEGEKTLNAGVAGLNRAAGFIQNQVSQKMRIRTTPRFTFIRDDSSKAGFDMIQKLNKLKGKETDS